MSCQCACDLLPAVHPCILFFADFCRRRNSVWSARILQCIYWSVLTKDVRLPLMRMCYTSPNRHATPPHAGLDTSFNPSCSIRYRSSSCSIPSVRLYPHTRPQGSITYGPSSGRSHAARCHLAAPSVLLPTTSAMAIHRIRSALHARVSRGSRSVCDNDVALYCRPRSLPSRRLHG